MMGRIWDFIRGRGYVNARAKVARIIFGLAEEFPGLSILEGPLSIGVPDWVKPHVPRALRDLECRGIIRRVGFKEERKGSDAK